MAYILVVEDEKPINDLISMNLKLVGHNFKKCYNGREAVEIINKEQFDLILLDVMLPDIDGFSVIETVEKLKSPVIFITAKEALSDRMKGFELGAEDYIIKPFETLELLARINVVLRRNEKEYKNVKIDDIEIFQAQRQVYKNGTLVEMTIKEFELLEVLLRNRNIALSREQLLEKVWGYDYAGETRTVDVHILKLRKKLEWEDRIKTVYKVGYRLEVSNEILA